MWIKISVSRFVFERECQKRSVRKGAYWGMDVFVNFFAHKDVMCMEVLQMTGKESLQIL